MCKNQYKWYQSTSDHVLYPNGERWVVIGIGIIEYYRKDGRFSQFPTPIKGMATWLDETTMYKRVDIKDVPAEVLAKIKR